MWMSVHREKSVKTSKDLLKGWLIALDEILTVCSPCFWVMLANLARQNKDKAALWESIPNGVRMKEQWRVSHSCPSMVHCSCDGHVVYIFACGYQALAKILVGPTPSRCLLCPDVVISLRIHRWEGKSASKQPCESSNASPDRCRQGPWVWWRYEWGPMLWPREPSWNTSVRQSAVLAETREGQVRVGADVSSVRGETGCFLWAMEQFKVVAQQSRLSPSGDVLL